RLVDAQCKLPAALDDLEHLAGETAVAAADGARAHHVAVERALGELRRDEEVVLTPTVTQEGRHEPISFGLEMDGAGHLGAGPRRTRLRRLLAANARALEQRGRRPPRLRAARLAWLLAAFALLRGRRSGELAIDMPVVAGPALLH